MYLLLHVWVILLNAPVVSAYAMDRSKVKCSGTRPICSSCEKRGIDCRYPKDSELRQRSNCSNRVSHTHSNTQTQRTNGDGNYRSGSLFSENVTHVSNFNVADPTEETSLTSLSGVRTSALHTLGRSTVPGNSPSGRGQYSYTENTHDLDSGNNADWLENGLIGDSAFAESFIPGLWDFFPMSPAQLPQPVTPLVLHRETQEDAPEADTRDHPSHTLSDFEHPWPMEWNPGPAQPLSLPPLEESQSYKPMARRLFSNNPVTASGLSNLKDRIKSNYDYGPWQQIEVENFPSADALNHAIDMYFVHFHAVKSSPYHQS